MRNKKIIIISAAIAAFIAFTAWMIWGNVAITVSQYTVESDNLPSAFDGFRIAQVSDLHNEEHGDGNRRILDMIELADPDIIVIVGDLIDRSRTDIEIAVEFTENACAIAPTYYVNGNHESSLSVEEYQSFCERLKSAGAVILENSATVIEKDGERITVAGISDPTFENVLSREELSALNNGENEFSILLSHRPRDFEQYAECGYDLVCSGHLHGGQFRLPFLGGLYAPSYGLFPKYDGGLYEAGESVMIVSRGLGNSSFPVRFNNPREIVIVELEVK